MSWLTGWKYRKKITIEATGLGAGTNYQIPFRIGKDSSVIGSQLHLENHSLSFPTTKNDGGDIAFASSDGSTPLDFWVERLDDLDNGLVSHWKLNDNLADTVVIDSKGSNTGTLVGGRTTAGVSLAGKINNAFNLDGDATPDYVNIPYNTSLYNNVMSVAWWAKSDKVAYTGDAFVVSQYDATANKRQWGIYIRASDDTYQLITSSNGTTNAVVALGKAPDLNWHHFAFVVNNATKEWYFYYDGVLQSVITASYTYTNQSSPLTIGTIATATAGFDGLIDDVRYYNRRLETAEIQAIYNSGNGTENEDNKVAKVWVEVQEDLNVDRDIYVYYNKASASNLSNGDNTFLFFDDFEGVTIDAVKWAKENTVTVGSSLVNLDRTTLDAKLYNQTAFSFYASPFRVVSKYKHPTRYRNRLYLSTIQNPGNTGIGDYGIFDPSIMWAGASTGLNLSISPISYFIEWINKPADFQWRIYYGDVSEYNVLTRNYGSAVANLKWMYFAGTENSASDFSLDYLYITRWVASEPYFSSVDTEEADTKDLICSVEVFNWKTLKSRVTVRNETTKNLISRLNVFYAQSTKNLISRVVSDRFRDIQPSKITDYDFGNLDITAFVREGVYLWIGLRTPSGNCKIRKVSAYNLNTTYFEMSLSSTVTKIVRMRSFNNNLYCILEDSYYLWAWFSLSNPRGSYAYITKPVGAEYPVDFVERYPTASTMGVLTPGIYPINAKVYIYNLVSPYAYELADMLTVNDAYSITMHKSANQYFVSTHSNPIKLITVYKVGSWLYYTSIIT